MSQFPALMASNHVCFVPHGLATAGCTCVGLTDPVTMGLPGKGSSQNLKWLTLKVLSSLKELVDNVIVYQSNW